MKAFSTLHFLKGLCCLLLISSVASADLAFNLDSARFSPNAPAATINDFITQNPNSGVDSDGTFFNLTNTSGNFVPVEQLTVPGGLDVGGGYSVEYSFGAGEADGRVSSTAGPDAHNDLNPITESFSNNATGTINITGLNANSVAGDTITLTIYGIGDNIGQETTFEVDYAGTIETGSTLFNGPGEARDSAVGSIPFVDFSFVADGVTDSISFDATEGGILNGFSVGITDATVAQVPEPSSVILLAGFGLLGLRRRK